MKKSLLLLSILSLFVCSSAIAGPGPVPYTDNRVSTEFQSDLNQVKADVSKLNDRVNRIPPPTPQYVPEKSTIYVSAGGAYLFDTDSNANESDLSTDNEWMANAAVGVDFGMIRTELEYGYQNVQLGSRGADSDIQSGMVNAYVDFPVMDRLSLYGQIGAGVGFVSYDDLIDDTSTSFIASAGAGINFAVVDNIDLNLGYKYIVLSDTTIDDIEVSYNTGMITTGLAYKF
jgi:opacity protein-like surface antigen